MKSFFLPTLILLILARFYFRDSNLVNSLLLAGGVFFFTWNLLSLVKVFRQEKVWGRAFVRFIEVKVGSSAARYLETEALVTRSFLNWIGVYPMGKLLNRFDKRAYDEDTANLMMALAVLVPLEALLLHLLLAQFFSPSPYVHFGLAFVEVYIVVLGCGYFNLKRVCHLISDT